MRRLGGRAARAGCARASALAVDRMAESVRARGRAVPGPTSAPKLRPSGVTLDPGCSPSMSPSGMSSTPRSWKPTTSASTDFSSERLVTRQSSREPDVDAGGLDDESDDARHAPETSEPRQIADARGEPVTKHRPAPCGGTRVRARRRHGRRRSGRVLRRDTRRARCAGRRASSRRVHRGRKRRQGRCASMIDRSMSAPLWLTVIGNIGHCCKSVNSDERSARP